MNFQPELAVKAIVGAKTMTRRRVSDNPRSPWWRERCAYRVGQDVAVTRGRGSGPAIGRVVVTSVESGRLGHLTHREARAEGFPTMQAFEAVWAHINGSYDPDEIVWRIGLRPVDEDDG